MIRNLLVDLGRTRVFIAGIVVAIALLASSTALITRAEAHSSSKAMVYMSITDAVAALWGNPGDNDIYRMKVALAKKWEVKIVDTKRLWSVVVDNDQVDTKYKFVGKHNDTTWTFYRRFTSRLNGTTIYDWAVTPA